MDSGSQLSASIDGLERAFLQMRHDLDVVADRMDVAFDKSNGPHPLKLAKRMEALESLISSLNGEWNDLQRRRNVILPVVSRHMFFVLETINVLLT